MEFSNPTMIWSGIGILLILAELVVPGGIIILLGAACLVVSGALVVGLVTGLVQALTLWFISSIVLLLGFRHLTQKLIGGDAHVDNTNEELDLYNQTAVVKVTIGPAQQKGRVLLQGIEWPALGDGSEIAVGTQVRVICRENIALVVEPIEPIDQQP